MTRRGLDSSPYETHPHETSLLSLDSSPYETSWSPVDQYFLWRGTGLCYQLDSFFLIRAIGLMMGLWSERCFVAASWQSQHLSVEKLKKINPLEMVPDQTQLRSKTFLIRPKCARRGYDQTQLRSKLPLIGQKCARRGYDHTQMCSQWALIRPKCARIRLWSHFSDQIDLWSDHLQTIVQTVVRSNFLPDPVISVWEHTSVRLTGSDHKPVWLWTSTWEGFKEVLSNNILSFANNFYSFCYFVP